MIDGKYRYLYNIFVFDIPTNIYLFIHAWLPYPYCLALNVYRLPSVEHVSPSIKLSFQKLRLFRIVSLLPATIFCFSSIAIIDVSGLKLLFDF